MKVKIPDSITHPKTIASECPVYEVPQSFNYKSSCTTGGHTDDGNSSEIYSLNLNTWSWKHLQVDQNDHKMSPRDKHTSWHHNNK